MYRGACDAERHRHLKQLPHQGLSMLKRLILVLAMLAGLLSPAWSAGTVPGFSLTPQYDLLGKIAPGCKLYVIQAGTVSTPQIAYQDSGLTLPSPGGSTLTCDVTGRLPQFFLADGSIKFRLTTATGTQVFVQDGLLVVGASSGGGGGSPVDATTILATGDIKPKYGTGILTGFVRANGRTIGSATSGATERANSDCQALFEYLWNADANLVVSTGRGASSNADWVANKTITLPDWRGRALAALDDMGNSAAGRLTSTYFGTSAIVLGAASTGTESFTIAKANIPLYNLTVTDPGHNHNLNMLANGSVGNVQAALQGTSSGAQFAGAILPATTGISVSSAGGGTPISVVQPTMLATFYIKL